VRQRVHAAAGHRRTRCSTSIGMPAAWAFSIKVLAGGQRDAQAARRRACDAGDEVTETASFTRGSGIAFRASAITRNPGSDATTAPKPYSEAGVRGCQQGAADGWLRPFGKSARHRLPGQHKNRKDATRRAPSTAQMRRPCSRPCTTEGALPMTPGWKEKTVPFKASNATTNAFRDAHQNHGKTARWDEPSVLLVRRRGSLK